MNIISSSCKKNIGRNLKLKKNIKIYMVSINNIMGHSIQHFVYVFCLFLSLIEASLKAIAALSLLNDC